MRKKIASISKNTLYRSKYAFKGSWPQDLQSNWAVRLQRLNILICLQIPHIHHIINQDFPRSSRSYFGICKASIESFSNWLKKRYHSKEVQSAPPTFTEENNKNSPGKTKCNRKPKSIRYSLVINPFWLYCKIEKSKLKGTAKIWSNRSEVELVGKQKKQTNKEK